MLLASAGGEELSLLLRVAVVPFVAARMERVVGAPITPEHCRARSLLNGAVRQK